MSIKRTCYHSVSVANRQLGGARASQAARSRHGREFVDFCLAHRHAISDLRLLEADWLRSWVIDLTNLGNSPATIANKIASVRVLSKARGANLNALGIANGQSIGIKQRSRVGAKSPVTDEVFDNAVTMAIEMGEEGFAHALKLERYLGLRGLEALMSTFALERFAKQARMIMNSGVSAIHISDGTKGGRPRDVAVIARYATVTLESIAAALLYANKNGGFLVQGSVRGGLKSARLKYHRLAAKVGLTGEFAPHSLRYRYCVDKLLEMKDAGYPRAEALAFASECLGHGPSRGRFVTSVYGRTVTNLLPSTSRQKNIATLIENLLRLAEGKPGSSSHA